MEEVHHFVNLPCLELEKKLFLRMEGGILLMVYFLFLLSLGLVLVSTTPWKVGIEVWFLVSTMMLPKEEESSPQVVASFMLNW
jgi:hypothetical protein